MRLISLNPLLDSRRQAPAVHSKDSFLRDDSQSITTPSSPAMAWLGRTLLVATLMTTLPACANSDAAVPAQAQTSAQPALEQNPVGARVDVDHSELSREALLAPLTELESTPEHQRTFYNLNRTLRLGHFRKLEVNDALSSDLFDAYLELLDKNRMYFLAADIEGFEPHRDDLDDSLVTSDLSFAYTVYNRFQQRNQERYKYLLERVEAGLDELDFTVDESITLDRSEADWATSKAELDDLWRKQLKSTVLNFKLSDKPLDEVEEILERRYRSQLHRLQQVNSTDVFQTYANALSMLYGPHTQYFSPRRSENFDIDMKLSLEGIGAVLQSEYENTKVVRLIPAGPAAKTGQLQPADLIVGVAQGKEGEMVDVVGWRLDEVVDLIRGPKGSLVRLQVVPNGSEGKLTKEVSIVRNTVKLEEQAASKHLYEVERDGEKHKIGVINIPTFYVDFNALRDGDPDYRSTTRDVERLLKELIDEGAEGLVIDLRNNGGGALKEAIDLAGLFIPQGPIVQIKDSWGQVRVEFDQNPTHYEIPLAVMVNRLSASASEIFAGAIKDYNRGIVVGSQTFGKGTVQVLHPLDSGQIKLTRAKFYRVSGDSTQSKGVAPHIMLPSVFDPEEIGESAVKGALPWDQVKPLSRQSMPAFDNLLDEIEMAHNKRVENEPDFAAIKEQIARQREQRLENSLSLNEAALKEQREENEAWQLALENKRRKAKNLPEVESLDELAEDNVTGTEINPEKDAALRESSQVLLDLIEYAKK